MRGYDMGADFKIECRKSVGNLHIYPKGILDGSSACQLMNLIKEKYKGKGRVFINTDQIKEALPFGTATLGFQIGEISIPRDRIYFKGKHALVMAPNGCRVIARNNRGLCRCDGNCAGCFCRRLDNKEGKRA